MTFLFYWSVLTVAGMILQVKQVMTFTKEGQFSILTLLVAAFFAAIPLTIIHLFIRGSA